MELDVAKIKLKGQGTVTDTERTIARNIIPKLTNADAATALRILDQLELEANENLTIAAQKGVYRPSGVGGSPQQQQQAVPQGPGQWPKVSSAAEAKAKYKSGTVVQRGVKPDGTPDLVRVP